MQNGTIQMKTNLYPIVFICDLYVSCFLGRVHLDASAPPPMKETLSGFRPRQSLSDHPEFNILHKMFQGRK